MKNFLKIGKKNALYATVMTGMITSTSMVNAGDVVLKSADGTINITGEFIEFKDDNYVVRTGLGDLRISASRVRCEGADCPTFDVAKADVHFFGSGTVGLGVMPLLLSGFAAHLDAEITVANTQTDGEIIANFVGDNGFGEDIGTYLVTATNSSDGFNKMIEGETDISMSARRITPKEARALRDAGKGNMVSVNQEHIFAVDSLVVIVNPENKAKAISIVDLQGIYSGVITNWNQLGGADLPIQVITHHESSGTLDIFNKRVFGKDIPATPADAIVGKDSNKIAAIVNENAGAISFVGYAFLRGTKPLNLISECGIETTPDPFSVKTEEYALDRRLYFYNTKGSGQKVKDFVSFARSEAADGVIAKAGFIDLGIARRAQTMESPRASSLLNAKVDAFEGNVIREMLAEMVKSDRLSSTFRFRPGSSKLDERGLLEMQRLGSYLQDLPGGSKVTLVGFTDDRGAFSANQRLSVDRAQQVVSLLQKTVGEKISHIEFSATGFGEISPSGCNNSYAGRGVNRRVEVWLAK